MSFTISRKTSATTKTEWIVPRLFIRNNVNLIDGRKGSGKSSLISRVLGDWHNAPNLPVWHKLKNILWLSSEEDYEIDIKPRLLQYGISEEQITTIDYKNGKSRKPIMPMDKDKLADFCRDNKVNALVVDPFRELIPDGWSINTGDQMRPYMTSFVSICSMCEITAFMPRHMRKAQGDFSGDDGEGSNQIKASIRHPLRIDVTEEKPKRRFLSVEESNKSGDLLPLQFSCPVDDNGVVKVEWLGHKEYTIDELKKLAQTKVKRTKLEEAKVLLLEALKEGEKSSKVLIQEAKDYGIGDRTLDDAKADLGIKSVRKVDLTTGNGMWVWKLPPDITQSPPSSEEDMQLTLSDLPVASDNHNPPAPLSIGEATTPDAQTPVKRKAKPKTKATVPPKATAKKKKKNNPDKSL